MVHAGRKNATGVHVTRGVAPAPSWPASHLVRYHAWKV